MKINMPVTGKEFPFPADRTLVSVTDLKGRITFCNEAFVTVSGYTAAELLGQPHNIVRHPDMPEEAFRDLWATISQGLPWTGLVKNRRKNGDHYWVRANATPMKDGNRITGYLSVRTVAQRDEIRAAEQLYADLRQQATQGHMRLSLRQGRVVSHSALGSLKEWLLRLQAWRLIWFQLFGAGISFAAAVTLQPWLAGLIALAATAYFGHLTIKLVLKPLRTLLDDSRRLGAGDLAHPVTISTSGLTGNLQLALKQLAVNIRTVVSDARTDVGSLKGIVAEIASGNQDLSARTESQASSLQQTAASMEQITGTVQQSADSAKRGATLALSTAAVATRSHEAVQAVAQSMDSINESSRRIGEIIQVVEGVAFQTNILALNAAVEAARAGESGRGFAVVASEVRSLAHRTSDAAKEIKRLIQESAERVNMGNVQVQEARARVDEALGSVGKVSHALSEISTAAVEQQSGIAQVSQAVAHMDTITQQNTAMVEELAASAHTMMAQVETISISTHLFRLKPGEKTVAEMDAVELRKAHAATSPA